MPSNMQFHDCWFIKLFHWDIFQGPINNNKPNKPHAKSIIITQGSDTEDNCLETESATIFRSHGAYCEFCGHYYLRTPLLP